MPRQRRQRYVVMKHCYAILLTLMLLSLPARAQSGTEFHFALPPTIYASYEDFAKANTPYAPPSEYYGTSGTDWGDKGKSPFFVVVTTRSESSFNVKLEYKHNGSWIGYVHPGIGSDQIPVSRTSPAVIPVRPFLAVESVIGSGTNDQVRWMQLPTGEDYTTPVTGMGNYSSIGVNSASMADAAGAAVVNENTAGVFRIMPHEIQPGDDPAAFEVVVFSAFGWSSDGVNGNTDGNMNNDAYRVLPSSSLSNSYWVPTDTPARADTGQEVRTTLDANDRHTNASYHVVVVPTQDTFISLQDRSGLSILTSPQERIQVAAGTALHIYDNEESGSNGLLPLGPPANGGYDSPRSRLSGMRIRSFLQSTGDFDDPADGTEIAVYLYEESTDSGEGAVNGLESGGTDPGYVQLLPLSNSSAIGTEYSYQYVIPPAMQSSRESDPSEAAQRSTGFDIVHYSYDTRAVTTDQTGHIRLRGERGFQGGINLSNNPDGPGKMYLNPGLGFQGAQLDVNPFECLMHTNSLEVGEYLDIVFTYAWGVFIGNPSSPSNVTNINTDYAIAVDLPNLCTTPFDLDTIDTALDLLWVKDLCNGVIEAQGPVSVVSRTSAMIPGDDPVKTNGYHLNQNAYTDAPYAVGHNHFVAGKHSIPLAETGQWVTNASMPYVSLGRSRFDPPATQGRDADTSDTTAFAMLTVICRGEDIPKITIRTPTAETGVLAPEISLEKSGDAIGEAEHDWLSRLEHYSPAFPAPDPSPHIAYMAEVVTKPPYLENGTDIPYNDDAYFATVYRIEVPESSDATSVEVFEVSSGETGATFMAYITSYVDSGGYGYSAGINSPEPMPYTLKLADHTTELDPNVQGTSSVDLQTLNLHVNGEDHPIELGSGLVLPAGITDITVTDQDGSNPVLDFDINPMTMGLSASSDEGVISYEMTLNGPLASEIRQVGEMTTLSVLDGSATIDQRTRGPAFAEFAGSSAAVRLEIVDAAMTTVGGEDPTFIIPEEAIGEIGVTIGSALERESISTTAQFENEASVTLQDLVARDDANGPADALSLSKDVSQTDYEESGVAYILFDAGRPVVWDRLTIDVISGETQSGTAVPQADPGNKAMVRVRTLAHPNDSSDQNTWIPLNDATPAMREVGETVSDGRTGRWLPSTLLSNRYLQVEITLDRFEYNSLNCTPRIDRISAEATPAAMSLQFDIYSDPSQPNPVRVLPVATIPMSAALIREMRLLELQQTRGFLTSLLTPGTYEGRATLHDSVTNETYGSARDLFHVQAEDALQSLARMVSIDPGPYFPSDGVATAYSDLTNTSVGTRWRDLIVELEYFHEVTPGVWEPVPSSVQTYSVPSLAPGDTHRHPDNFSIQTSTTPGRYKVQQRVYIDGVVLADSKEAEFDIQETDGEYPAIAGRLEIEPKIVDLGRGGASTPLLFEAINITNQGNVDLNNLKYRFLVANTDTNVSTVHRTATASGGTLRVGESRSFGVSYALDNEFIAGDYQVVLECQADELVDSASNPVWAQIDLDWFRLVTTVNTDHYVAVPLRQPEGYSDGSAYGINSRGDIVGSLLGSAMGSYPRAILWPAYCTEPTDLHAAQDGPNLWELLNTTEPEFDEAGDFESVAVAINDQRYIAGSLLSLVDDPASTDSMASPRAVGYVTDPGGIKIRTLIGDAATSGSIDTYGNTLITDISNQGKYSSVVGSYDEINDSSDNRVAQIWLSVPNKAQTTLKGSTHLQQSDSLGYVFTESLLNAVNVNDDAIGASFFEHTSNSNTKSRRLNNIDSEWALLSNQTSYSHQESVDINDAGYILERFEGSSDSGSRTSRNGVASDHDWTTLLDLVAGTERPRAINNRLTMVGEYEVVGSGGETAGAIWRSGDEVHKANDLIINDSHGWNVKSLNDIADNGVAIGQGHYADNPTAVSPSYVDVPLLMDPFQVPDSVLAETQMWLRADVGIGVDSADGQTLLRWTGVNDPDPAANVTGRAPNDNIFLDYEECCERAFVSFGPGDGSSVYPGMMEYDLLGGAESEFTLSLMIRPFALGSVGTPYEIMTVRDASNDPVLVVRIFDGVLEAVWESGSGSTTTRIATLGTIVKGDETLITIVKSVVASEEYLQIFRNGIEVFNDDAGDSAGIIASKVMFQGESVSTTQPVSLDLAEAMLVGTALDTSDLKQLEAYLERRYGLTVDSQLREGTLYVRGDRGIESNIVPDEVDLWSNLGQGWGDLVATSVSRPAFDSADVFGCRPGIRFEGEPLSTGSQDYIIILDRSGSMFEWGTIHKGNPQLTEKVIFEKIFENYANSVASLTYPGYDINDHPHVGGDEYPYIWAMEVPDTQQDHLDSSKYYTGDDDLTRAGAASNVLYDFVSQVLGQSSTGITDARIGMSFFSECHMDRLQHQSLDLDTGTTDDHFLGSTPGLSNSDPASSVAKFLSALELTTTTNDAIDGDSTWYPAGFAKALNSFDPARPTDFIFITDGAARRNSDAHEFDSRGGANRPLTSEEVIEDLDATGIKEYNDYIGGVGVDSTYDSFLAMAREYGVKIHTFGFALDDDAINNGARAVLDLIATRTGGTYNDVPNPDLFAASLDQLFINDLSRSPEAAFHFVFNCDEQIENLQQGQQQIPSQQVLFYGGDEETGVCVWLDLTGYSVASKQGALKVEYWNRDSNSTPIDGTNWASTSAIVQLSQPNHLLVTVSAAGNGTGRRLRALLNGVPMAARDHPTNPDTQSDADTIIAPVVGIGPFDIGGTSRDIVLDGVDVTGAVEGMRGYVGEMAVLPHSLSEDEQLRIFKHVDRDYEIIIPVRLHPVANASVQILSSGISGGTFGGGTPGGSSGGSSDVKTILLRGNGTTDPNVNEIPDLQYDWFIDDVFFQSGKNITTYSTAFSGGSHTARLVVTDPTGLSDSEVATFILELESGTIGMGFEGSGTGGGGTAGVLGSGMPLGQASGTSIGSATASVPSGASQRTVAVWVEPDDTDPLVQTIFQQGGSAPGDIFKLGMSKDVVELQIGSHVMGVDRSSVGGYSPGWHHLAVVVPEGALWSDQVRLYINGQHETVVTLSGSGSPEPINSGSTGSSLGEGVSISSTAVIDEVLFEGRAMSDAEILWLASRRPAFHWRFNEGSGSVIGDASGGGSPLNGSTSSASAWATSQHTISGYAHGLSSVVTADGPVDFTLGASRWTAALRFQVPSGTVSLLSDDSGSAVIADADSLRVRLMNGLEEEIPIPCGVGCWVEVILYSRGEIGEVRAMFSGGTTHVVQGNVVLQGTLKVGDDSPAAAALQSPGAIDTIILLGADLEDDSDRLVEQLFDLVTDDY